MSYIQTESNDVS